MRIVPAILTKDIQEFSRMLKLCSKFSEYIQIDIMDGKFVPSKSITSKDLESIEYKSKSFLEAHLMVEEPLEWVETFHRFGVRRIIFHFEIKERKEKIIEKIRELNLSVGIAVNPSTEIEDFSYLVDKVDSVLFMSVNPGFYGSKFIPEVLGKIKEFRKIYPKKYIGIDGGVKLSNLKEISKLGVDAICVGSAILKSDNPAQSYLQFSQVLKI